MCVVIVLPWFLSATPDDSTVADTEVLCRCCLKLASQTISLAECREYLVSRLLPGCVEIVVKGAMSNASVFHSSSVLHHAAQVLRKIVQNLEAK